MTAPPLTTAPRCPACGHTLESGVHKGVPFLGCRRCRGAWFEAGVLARATETDVDLPPLPGTVRVKGSRLACPRCRLQLDMRPYSLESGVTVDVCPGCGGVWLDHGEYGAIKAATARGTRLKAPAKLAPDGRPVDEDTRAVLAHYDQAGDGDVTGDDYLLMLFLGIPKELNVEPRRPPVVNWTLLLANVVVFAWEWQAVLHGREATVRAWAFDPANPTLLTALTAAFMHAGPIHLVGNLFMLWMMGDNVEDHLGPVGYLGFYLAGALASTYAFYVANAGSSAAMMGASGAIAAVMAAYFIACPRARIAWVVLFMPFTIPFTLFAIAWIGLQLALMSAISDSHVAYSAHVGGFAFGLVVYGLFRIHQWRRTGR